MALAARLGPPDARVPCPLCGGLIHPIAGKCKHCKADLTTYHAARPAANAPLPSLHRAPPANGDGNGRASTPPPHAPAADAVAVPIATAYDASQPVLPPRPTGQSSLPEPRVSGWRSWPVVVIILAMAAIIVAVVLMIWPAGGDRAELGGKRTGASPAPDRMPTAPEINQPPPADPRVVPTPRQVAPTPPPSGATPDPWSGQADPPAAPPDPAASASAPDPRDDGLDPFGSQHPAPTLRGRRYLRSKLAPSAPPMMIFTMMEHMCRKILQCGTNDPTIQTTCDAFSRSPQPPPDCAAADRCLQRIDTMSCGVQTDSLSRMKGLMTQFRDCVDAINC